jgi:hypothetical protein
LLIPDMKDRNEGFSLLARPGLALTGLLLIVAAEFVTRLLEASRKRL